MEQLQSSEAWWKEVSQSKEKFADWLQKQYHGENTAAQRIRQMAEETEVEAHKFVLEKIALQEEYHAKLVGDLLEKYGVQEKPAEEFGESRYWSTVAPAQEDFLTKCAIAGHAEAMRLERIRVIVTDKNTPLDVYSVFCIILQDELWHEKAFKAMAGEETLAKVKPCHTKARELLGLEP